MGSVGGEEAMQGPTGSEDRILVSVRLRPLNNKERARNDVSDWECINDTTVICKNNLSASDRSLYPTTYTFDRIFRPDSSTRKVYEEGAKKVALSVVSGINSSVFAYGQTSSGKTFTMSGITEYTVADIFNYIEKHKEREFVMKLSAIEIYNECVRDLLSLDSTPRRLLDDPERGTVVERLTEETLSDWSQFIELLSFCETQRQIGETALNEASSRSHQIIRLTIESSPREYLGNEKSSYLTASVNFVDLAGSERASQTLSAGTRLKEGCHINRSLLTLGTVIRKLSKGKGGHIPFRDSKLTRLLQSSLGGNARTAIICTMSPARSHVEQTRNTLLFASCAKEVSTNAQVNVVISDKELVKQLQKELARMERELKLSCSACFTSDCATLLRKKDLEIDMLRKEVAELTMQRDLAHCQIKNMLQVVGDDLSSTEFESSEPRYPKLRVRSSWDFDNIQSETPNFANLQCAESIKSFDVSQFSDEHSFSSDENLFQLPDFEINLPGRDSFSMQSVIDFDFARSDLNSKVIEEQHDESLEDSCIGVMYNKSEDNKYTDSNLADLSPNPYDDSNASSPGADTATSELTVIDHRDEANLELGSSGLKDDKELKIFTPEKISPWLSENFRSSSRSLRVARTRSCKASLMMNPSSYWFEKEEVNDNTPPSGIQKHFRGRSEGFERKFDAHQPDFNNNADRLQRNGSENSVVTFDVDAQNGKSSPDKESDREGTSDSERKEEENIEGLNTLADREVPETRSECIMSAKSSKDVGLDPIQSDEEGPNDWPSEFRRLQREIIELWHACNVPLSHRTYFFLLIKGDSSDSIYMEVELRRLSYLKQTFSQGNKKAENGRFTLASSMRNLRRERQMLSKQIQRRLSKSERHNLYLKWGIRLSSRNRRLQLAYRLWTETDMEHIRESAAVVAKLIGTVEPDQAFKEMFGLNFAPPLPPTSRKSFGWTSSIKHIL